MKALRLFMEECRGLTKTEENLMMSRLDSEFLWLLPYTSDRELSNLFEFVPQDLRLIDQPLQTRLSPSLAGSPDDDIADFRLMRDVWIPTQARETSLNSQYRLKIRIGTFNVNGKLPSQDLSSWILSQASTSSANVFSNSLSKNISPTAANLLVLGFQELDLSTEALIYSSATAREDAWCRAVFAALGEKMELYEKLVSRQHVGLLIVVIAKKTLISCFSNVQTSIASTGIMGIMGNKGGSAVRLTFTPPISNSVDVISPGPTILTFVNSHLAAFDEMAEKRNSDFQEISKKLKFAPPLSDRAGTVPVHMSVYESDVLFWMVNLNYRIDLHNEEVRGILASDKSPGRLETLLRYDQLKKASRSKKAFYGFLEHPITHLPTYRFSPGIETDALGYDTKRKPAWTDRILHMAGRNASVRQFSYTCHPQITMSDHKPVAADFSLDVDVYDQNSYSDIYRKLFKSLARMEDYPNRVIKLDTTSVDMGFVSYKRSTSQKLNLTNSGQVRSICASMMAELTAFVIQSPCAYRFVPHAPDTAAHPEWLYIEPMQAILLPGESLQVTITSHVDNEIACKLNLGQKDLRTTLILHTILGKDHFISVAAEYQRTCFATKLSWLTRLPGPVRSLNSLHDLRPEDQPINAPSEIMRLVNWMMSGHVDDGMFTLPGDESVIDTIRECLETGDEFPFLQADTDLTVMLSFGETLLRLLDSLVDPVVPIFLHSQCTQMKNRDEAFEVWISLTALLHFLCQSDNQPSEKAERIATIFTPILLRDEPDSDLPSVSLLGKRKFLLYFIA
ncbi:Inositol polyphosphate 5-phosphatase OCRL-1 [Termitomyces sp. J132]|nr:Inositol polyphosphate 5-phosphatase OCRL-1 [Termitomyces sp. J132]